MFEYTNSLDDTVNVSLPTEKLIVEKINNDIDNNFASTSRKTSCLAIAPNGLVEGIRIASKSKFYCVSKIKENGKYILLNPKSDLDKIKDFAIFIRDEVARGAYRDLITEKNNYFYRTNKVSSTTNKRNKNNNEKTYDTEMNRKIADASIKVNQILDIMKHEGIIESKGETIKLLKYAPDYVYHMRVKPTIKFKSKFMPKFKKFVEFQMMSVKDVRVKNEINGTLNEVDEMLN